MAVTDKKAVQLLKFAWRANRIGLFQFGDNERPIQFYFVRGDLVAFRFPLEATSGTIEESLYILNNDNLDHTKKRRAVLSIEKLVDTRIVDQETFDKALNVLNTRCALGFDYVPAPTVSTKATDETGGVIELTFSKAMLGPQDPAEFSVVINDGNPVIPIDAAILDEGTNKKFGLTLPEDSIVENGDVVTITYTRGTVLAGDGGVLASFADASVTNNVPAS